jgi:5-methylcytosine-specific restriction endonuclease McrA
MKKPYSKLSPDELREYHRVAWREYYYRNSKRINIHSRQWQLDHPERHRKNNLRATRKYKEKTRLSNKRQEVLSRDNFACVKCGATKQLVIHHLDQVSWHNTSEPNNELSNLQTLCRSCHTTLHNALRSRV